MKRFRVLTAALCAAVLLCGFSDTITLPDGGNYIGIECEDFTGNIELNIE